jgi:DNA polymerase (family 10)
MTNAEIAAIFEQVAEMLEYRGENPFRIRAYRLAARRIESMLEPLSAIVADPAGELTAIEGIGGDLAAKITELVETGRLTALEELRAAVPAVAFEVMRVPGIGPKKARALVEQLNLDSLEGLERACREGRVRSLAGFGAKSEAAILENVDFARSPEHARLLWYDADAIVTRALAHLRESPAVARVEAAGSWRRGCQTVGDIDIVVESERADRVMDRLEAWDEVETVLLRGDTKESVRIGGGIQLDLRVVAKESFGAALQYFTGSKEHNVLLRGRARERDLTLNEYGIFPADGDSGKGRERTRGDRADRRLPAGGTEEDLYAALGLPWIPPELREGRDEIALAAEGRLPSLVRLEDVLGDLHMHTDATDGENTLAEMARAARERGLRYIAITDHSQRVSMARGLDRRRLLAQWSRIDRLNESLADEARREGLPEPALVVLKGIEVDMLERGGLDLPDEVLLRADWVVASLHYGQNQPRDRITARVLEAVEHPAVGVIGHPTGRLIHRRPPFEIDMAAVIEAAARTGTLLEINANPLRLDLDDIHAAAARRAGVRLVVSTDAHSTAGLDVMRCGILQARRAGLEPHDVANTLPLTALRALLASAPKRGGPGRGVPVAPSPSDAPEESRS